MALTQNRNTPHRQNTSRNLALAAGAVVYAGGMVAMAANGFVNAASTATGLTAVGVATHYQDNTTGDNGDQHVDVQRGFFGFANSAGADEVTRADIGQVCYMVDDETVAKTSGTDTRSPAGIVDDVDGNGVWVNIDPTNGVAASA
ncbi:hypothetical protein [Halomonas llamarensis]|uniref:Uncharacterized protein n=1 Tax=Halomonas llamarensis TaxID=2945104 RepID=A0ABT0SUX0_9GAMM|nr:hypothetical protein [Halomonas llamarensis]MCL7931635.1 hypothetical protein [Halomonas llamarensis]